MQEVCRQYEMFARCNFTPPAFTSVRGSGCTLELNFFLMRAYHTSDAALFWRLAAHFEPSERKATMEPFLLDLKYAARSLWRSKGFAFTVLLTFSVCIGANTALFAVVNSVLLRPLPVAEANSILLMCNEYPKAGVTGIGMSASGDYFDRMREMTVFESQAMFRHRDQTLELNGLPQRIPGMAVTPSWFKLLRVAPALGRPFTEEDAEPGHDQEVILSHGLWQQLFAADMAAVGREIRLSGRPFTVVGVMPAGFDFIEPEIQLWIPLAFTAEEKNIHHSNNWYHIGRLKPGARLEQAQAQVDAVNAENLERFPQFKEILINAGFHTTVKPLQELLTGGVSKTLYLLWGGAFLVLLIGALNVANLALSRLALRRKEMATRIALGASRAQLVRQLILENLELVLLGGVGGIGLGALLLRALGAFGLEHFPRAGEVHMEGSVVAVSLALSFAAGIVVALFPIASLGGIRINDTLHDAGRTGTTGKKTRSVREFLVAAQIGFASVLLVGAALLLASFRLLSRVDTGFQPNGVVTASLVLPRAKYANADDRRKFMDRALPAVRAIPGVVSAGASDTVPLSGRHSDTVILAEGYQMKPGESLVSPLAMVVTPGYFEAMGIQMVRGRRFDDRDNQNAPGVVIVDERLAQHFWPNQDPVGRRMYEPGSPDDLLKIDEHTVWLTVVGVARTLRYENLDDSGAAVGAFYYPNSQRPANGFTFAVKSDAGQAAVVSAIRAEVFRLDPELAVFDVHSMTERIDLSLSSRRTSTMLANAFGGVALFLAMLGIYGVLAYLVAQRTREIGIRVALGSSRAGILKLVLRQAGELVLVGLVLGIAGAASLQKAIANEIYGVRPFDPLILASVAALLGVVALAACALPVRRALTVEPVIALRNE